MRRKHTGLVSMLIILLTFFGMLAYGILYSGHIKAEEKIPGVDPVPDIPIPEKSLTDKMMVLSQRMPSLTILPETAYPFSFKIFGHEPVKEMMTRSDDLAVSSKNAPVTLADEEIFSYQLNLSFYSKKNSFCVIDGRLYSKNDSLPDTGKITAIEHDRVRIKKNNMEKWVYMTRENETVLPEKEGS